MNKKGQSSTDTPIVISIFIFQAFIIVALGFINVIPQSSEVGQTVNIIGIGDVGFTQNITSNISLLGWFNTILFAPLIIGLIYIFAKLIRGGG